MKAMYLTRQLDIIPVESLVANIHIVGAGAIGSFVTLALAKMGFCNITVYDDDEIDPENMNCQFYPEFSIGQKKVIALKQMIKTFTGTDINIEDRRVLENDKIVSDYLIVAVDSMEARKTIYSNCFTSGLFIDPRMSAEHANLETVRYGDDWDIANYEKTLFTDDEAVQERCTAKSTMYTVMLIAGQVAKLVKDDLVGDGIRLRSFEWAINSNQLIAFDINGLQR